MLITEKKINEYKPEYLSITAMLDKDCRPESFMFFDIETSGLDSRAEFIWLIGAICLEQDNLIMYRFFSEEIGDESRLLEKFHEKLDKHPQLVHYNGDSFDIRFIKTRAELYKGIEGIAFPATDYFKNTFSHDLYRLIKKNRELLNCTGIKQKEMELYCGYNRSDRLSGTDLIGMYINYLAAVKVERSRLKSYCSGADNQKRIAPYSPNICSGLPLLGNIDIDALYNNMLLHNSNDLTGMLMLREVVEYICFINHPKEILIASDNGKYTFYIHIPDTVTAFLEKHGLSAVLKEKLPGNAYYEDCRLSLCFSSFDTRLKHFYLNYKDYFYLPAEDMAIHRTVAEFVEVSSRTKATAETCYTWHSGGYIIFPPLDLKTAEKAGIILFKEDYYSKRCFISTTELKNDNSHLQAIVAEYLKLLFKSR